MTANPPELRELLPAPWRRPSVLLWVYLLPQLILLLLNLRSYHLVSGEMSPEQRGQAFTLGLYAVLLLLGVGSLWALTRGREFLLRWSLALPLLLAHIGYLWLVVTWLDTLIPRTVAFWMLPAERVLYHQFALVMPAVFHAALVLACFPTRVGAGRDLARSALLLFAVPAVWYVVVHVAFRVHRMSVDVPDVVVFLLITLSTLLLTAALLRVLVALWRAIRRAGGHGRLLLLALIGIAGPLGGLWLNARIAFPVDFQSLAVYVLAALNGFVLMLPSSGPRSGHRWVWLAQCAVFPFSLYFFVVFLPFLPLALLAILAMGAGFLMLVPTALFLIHLSVLRDGWQAARAGGRGWLTAGLLALLVLPGFFGVRAWQDRTALRAALDYLYEPKQGQTTFPGDVNAVGRSLRNLRDFKAGLQLPFLTEFYSQVVFGGLVLPDARMQDVHRAFFGRDLEAPDESRLTNPLMGGGRRRPTWGRMRTPDETPRNVVLSNLRSEVLLEEGVERLMVTVQMTNQGPGGSEFVAPITLPAGTWISGFWLDVNGERVPGRLFEKKTALWVYEMIRDQTRRDPGILLYRDPKTVELRVFPFATNETRTVQIEFLYPAGFAEPIQIGPRAVDPMPAPRAVSMVRVAEPKGPRMWLVAPEAFTTQPVTERSTYLHVIVDRSAGSPELASWWPNLESAAQQFGVSSCLVSLANFEQENLTPAPTSLGDARARLASATLPARGGFCRDRAVKDALRWWRQHQPDAYPLIVVLSASTNAVAPDADLAYFASAWPGLDGYIAVRPGGAWQVVDWQGRETHMEWPRTWVRLDLGGVPHWIPARHPGSVVLMDEAPATPVALPMEIQHTRYRQGAQAWFNSHARWANPGAAESDLSALVESSRASGVLVPATSYIVVENSAQWRFLEQSEKKKLSQNSALAFRDAPEPSTWLLLLGFAAWYKWRPRRTAPSHSHS